MVKLNIDEELVKQIERSKQPVQLVSPDGRTVGVLQPFPPQSEIKRAQERAKKGGARVTWDELCAQLEEIESS